VPIILSNMVPDGKTIIEALIEHSEVPCAIALLTPDDVGYPIGKENLRKSRARQNVVLELGMFLSKLGREKVIILHKGDLELPSDINGLIYLAYKMDVREVKAKLAAALQKIGFNIDIGKLSQSEAASDHLLRRGLLAQPRRRRVGGAAAVPKTRRGEGAVGGRVEQHE